MLKMTGFGDIWCFLTCPVIRSQLEFWRDAQFDTIRLCLIKVAGHVTEMVTPHQNRPADRLSLPNRLRHGTGQIAKLPP
jgi:hypothetical protein